MLEVLDPMLSKADFFWFSDSNNVFSKCRVHFKCRLGSKDLVLSVKPLFRVA